MRKLRRGADRAIEFLPLLREPPAERDDLDLASDFDGNGGLLAGAAAIIGALTVANRISSYRRYRKPSLLERLFRLSYKPAPPVYHRNFRPHLDPKPIEPRRTIRKPVAPPSRSIPRHGPAPRSGGAPSRGGHSGHGGPGGHGGHGGPGGRR